MSTDTKTLSDFIEEHEITAEAVATNANPNMDSDTPMHHWLVTLSAREGALEVPFSQGYGITKDPTAAVVLDCLASDASSIADEPDWLEWAKGMGYESIEDAERARSTYETIQEQSGHLQDILGREAFEELLYSVERL